MAGVDLPHVFVAETHALEGAGAEVLHEYVGLAGHAADEFESALGLHVHDDAALVAVDSEEYG